MINGNVLEQMNEVFRDEINAIDIESIYDCVKKCIEDNTAGCTVFSKDGDLCLGYLDAENNIIGHTFIMPDIINVSNPNEKTVFVEFADNTKEVAQLNDGDVFSLEVGVLICIVKKMLSDVVMTENGSSAYNKIIKYALGKLDASKKKREEELKKGKGSKSKISSYQTGRETS